MIVKVQGLKTVFIRHSEKSYNLRTTKEIANKL